MSSTSSSSLSAAITSLHAYSACDIADALLALAPKSDVSHRAGFLSDLTPLPGVTQKIIAPAFTVLFHPKLSPIEPNSIADVPSNIPKGAQWSDLVAADSLVVVSQPAGQYCASVGGHHAARIATLGAKGLVVSGRVRDVEDIQELTKASGFGVWSKGTSVVGAGAEAKPWATQVALDLGGLEIQPGDLVFCDPKEGVVRIPKSLVEDVVAWLPKHAEQEEKVKGLIAEGKSVEEAFKIGRGKL